jgi:type IV pilus assembly protein PilV
MKTHSTAKRQGGAFLLEALVAILVISFGILGIVGLQARSLAAVGDAQYRGEAAFYAQSLAGRMWAHDPTDVVAYYATGGTGYTNWNNQVTAAGSGLPGAATTVSFTDLQSANGVMALITITWQAPNDDAPHTYVTEAVVGNNVAP